MTQTYTPSQTFAGTSQAASASNANHTRRFYNPVQRDAVMFLETSAESGGVHTLLEMEVAPGGGNGLHFHTTFAEHFTVLSGEFGVQVGKEQFVLKPGQSAVAPIGVNHRWFNSSQETALVQVELRQGNAGFEQSLQIAYGMARDGLMNEKGIPHSLTHLALLIELSDTGVAGFVSVLAPLMRMLARRARRQGIDRELIERYCQM